MPNAKTLKDDLATFLAERQRELDELEKRTAVERTRLEMQIQKAREVLDSWDKRVLVTDVIDALTLAGVQIRTQ